MESIPERSQDYRLIEKAIRFIEANARRQPELEEIAAAVGLSECALPAEVHTLGGHQPETLPAIPDQRECKGAAGAVREFVEHDSPGGAFQPGTPA